MVEFPHSDLILLGLPAAAFVLGRRYSPGRDAWWKSLLRCLLVFALALVAARPFLISNGLGSGEAYNYSLALRDAIEQMRHGVMPPLVGQTIHAFNGRIHPLRNAPYLFYLADLFDILTGRRLGAWELQNLSLAFSFVALFFATYGGLRWGTACPRPLALALTFVLGFCPGVLAAAYSANLFMTVHAAPFVVIALAACFRPCRDAARPPDAVLAAALAGAWLAHPPVAYWLTVSAVLIRGLLFWRYPTWRAFRGLVGLIVLFALLAGFVFASVGEMSDTTGAFSEGIRFGDSILPILHAAFPGCLLPEHGPNTPTSVSDFQLGYAGWALLAGLIWLLARTPASIRRRPRIYCAVWGAVASALLLLALTLPVPGLTDWLWTHAPVSAQSITNIWVFQRSYLLALALLVFAAAQALPRLDWSLGGRRRIAWAAAAAALVWTGWEAHQLLGRGMLMRWRDDETWRGNLSSNVDLTVTSYSFLETPADFTYGVADPDLEFRLLRNGQDELDSNYAAAERTGRIVGRGSFRIIRRGGVPAIETQLFTLEPGKHYLITFAFHTGPHEGELLFAGPALSRAYLLQGSAGHPFGFGMNPGNRTSISFWTSLDKPETVALTFAVSDWASRPPDAAVFADYTLREIVPSALPIRVESYLPLRFTVDAPEEGDFVETPRRWLPGYAATVMTRTMPPLRSPWHNVMVPVPKGTSEVVLAYPGSPLLRAAFWATAAGWAGFGLWLVLRFLGFRPGRFVRGILVRLGRAAWRRKRPLLIAIASVGIAAGIAVSVILHRLHLAEVGPIRVTLFLPFHQVGHVEPIVTTGKTGAGTTVYVRYLDGGRIKIGADIWGGAWESDPITVNYFERQSLVVDSSGLYPLESPIVAALPAAERRWLRGQFRVEWNGRPVISLNRSAYDSTIDEVVIGSNAIGSSVAEAQFTGVIQKVRRLPIPRRLALSGSQSLVLRVRFPIGRAGLTEPLIALGPRGAYGACAVAYLPDDRLRFFVTGPQGQVLNEAVRSVDRRPAHELILSLQAPAPGQTVPAVGLRLDGADLWPVGAATLNRPEEVEFGLDPSAPADWEDRFTGSELTLLNAPDPAQDGARGSGPLRLVLSFPTGRTGTAEPLVSTGVTGKGDFVFVEYLDAHHLRFGYDHWGVSGGRGNPVAVDYDRPHDVVISFGSLFPEGTGGDASDHFSVRLDGVEVYRAKSAAWPSDPKNVTVGQNQIQGSSCGPDFTGLIYSAERLGTPDAKAAASSP